MYIEIYMACNYHKPKCGKSEDVCSASHQRNFSTSYFYKFIKLLLSLPISFN